MEPMYVHTLKDLTPKTAEIESVHIVRELKKQTPFPFSEEALWKMFAVFFVSKDDRAQIAHALQLIKPTIEDIQLLIRQQNPNYEQINLVRSVNMLEEIPRPMVNSLVFLEEMAAWQEPFIKEVTEVLNAIPDSKDDEGKKKIDEKLSVFFEKILRNKEFYFHHSDIVNEAQVGRMTDLHESLAQGYFFHVSLQEHLDRNDFDVIKRRIPLSQLEPAEKITGKVALIRDGVKRAQECNMRFVKWALILYGYIKWLSSQ